MPRKAMPRKMAINQKHQLQAVGRLSAQVVGAASSARVGALTGSPTCPIQLLFRSRSELRVDILGQLHVPLAQGEQETKVAPFS